MWPHKHDGGQQLAGHALAKSAQHGLDLTSTGEPPLLTEAPLARRMATPFLLTSSSSPTAGGLATGNPSFSVCPQPQGSRPPTAPAPQPNTGHTLPFPGTPNCCSEKPFWSNFTLLAQKCTRGFFGSCHQELPVKQACFIICVSK